MASQAGRPLGDPLSATNREGGPASREAGAASREAAGALVVVSTPIGNLGDLSPRAGAELARADVIACEDTRRTRKLLSHLGIPSPRLVASHAYSESFRAAEFVDLITQGSRIVLVTDAGTPGVSDPGTAVVVAVRAAGLPVEVVPGPSAALAALVLSGFRSDRFCVEGFLPRSGRARTGRLMELATETRTSVVFEAPARVASTLADLLKVCGGDRLVAVVRELTKIHEESDIGQISDVLARWAEPRRGEHVIVLAGASRAKAEATDEEVVAAMADQRSEGLSRRDSADAVAQSLRIAKKRAYSLGT